MLKCDVEDGEYSVSIPLIRKESVRKPSDPAQRAIIDALTRGCYALRLTMHTADLTSDSQLVGTFRVERVSETVDRFECRITADLYASASYVPQLGVIPVFPRSAYRVFFALANDGLRFSDAQLQVKMRSALLINTHWNGGPTLRLLLRQNATNGTHAFDVEVRKGSSPIGDGSLAWLAGDYRRLTVHPASAGNSAVPLNNGTGTTWESIFREAGWALGFGTPQSVSHPNGNSTWTLAELHATLSRPTTSGVSLDEEWFVHLLCVEAIDAFDKSLRGVMFDFGDVDNNEVPRQACAIAAGWRIPNEPTWQAGSRTRFHEFVSLYFRTAVHEIGHALNLQHPTLPNELRVMSTTDDLIGRPGFPDNLPIQLSEEERVWLRHQPDPVVRPGGLPYPATMASSDRGDVPELGPTASVRLSVVPLMSAFPLGAPVRLTWTVSNQGRRGIDVPESLGFSCGGISVLVTGPGGTSRLVNSTVSACSEMHWHTLAAGRSQDAAVTLWRNHTGPLFPVPGRYVVSIRVPIRRGKHRQNLVGETQLSVQVANSVRQRKLAERVLRSTELQRVLTVGGEYTRATARLIKSVLENEELRPHFQFIEAKRLGTRCFKRKCNLRKMSGLLSPSTVMTHQEIRRAVDIIRQGIRDGSRAAKSIAAMRATLSFFADSIEMPDSVRRRMKEELRALAKELRVACSR